MKLGLVRTVGGTLRGADPISEEVLDKLHTGDMLHGSLTKLRNPDHHRKGMALLNYVFKSQEKYTNFEDLLVEFKLKTGWYKEHLTMKGKIVYVPKSISFGSMDQIQFEEFYSKAIDVALKDFIPEENRTDFENIIVGFV